MAQGQKAGFAIEDVWAKQGVSGIFSGIRPIGSQMAVYGFFFFCLRSTL
jgi:hypothetical protein